MKTKGIFRILAAPLLALVAALKTSRSTSHDGKTTYGQGRAAFYGISSGRQHNVKTRHPL